MKTDEMVVEIMELVEKRPSGFSISFRTYMVHDMGRPTERRLLLWSVPIEVGGEKTRVMVHRYARSVADFFGVTLCERRVTEQKREAS